MNLENVFRNIAAEDPEFYERTAVRRSAIRTFMKGAALTTLPLALGGLLKKVYAQTGTSAIGSILNFALTLEHLEAEFYKQAVYNAAGIGITGAALTAFSTIRDQEVAHVKFLQDTLLALNETVAPKPQFDFSGGAGSGNGLFRSALIDNYDFFLVLAQVFEDTGVRAYKGQVVGLMAENDILKAAMQIHSVEARHAAHVRMIRATRNSSSNIGTIKPWITRNDSNILTGNVPNERALRAAYAGEDNTTQSAINLAGFASADVACEAFDEPLGMQAVADIIKPFIVATP